MNISFFACFHAISPERSGFSKIVCLTYSYSYDIFTVVHFVYRMEHIEFGILCLLMHIIVYII